MSEIVGENEGPSVAAGESSQREMLADKDILVSDLQQKPDAAQDKGN